MSTDHATLVPTHLLPYGRLPGPAGLPLLGNALQVHPEMFHQQLEAWAAQYGPRFRFQITDRRFMAITQPEAIASVLRRRPHPFKKGSRLVQVAKDLGIPGVFSANDDAWRRQRQLVLPGLDPSHLRTYLPAIVTVTGRLRGKWQAKAAAGQEIDLLTDLMRYTVDVTTCLAFGQDLNTLDQGDEAAIQRHLNVIFPALFNRILAPVDVRHWIPDRAVQGHVDALQQAVQGFIAQTRAQLAQRPALREAPENLIQSLVATRDAGDDLTDTDLAGNVLTLLLAGEDTTAHTLAWMLWLLGGAPEELDRARDEVERVVGVGRVPDRLEQLAAMDIVDACANEAMRLKPVAPLNIAEAAEDVEVDGVAVPRGTFVVCVMRPAGMDPARFEAPDAFRPGRWLEPAAGQAAPGPEGAPPAGGGQVSARMFGAKRVVMPFGAGPRVCPGRYLALAEIKMVIGMLLSNFEVDRVWSASGEPRECLKLTMAPVGLRMTLRPRAAPH